MSKLRIFDRRALLLIALGYWILIGLPLWWFFVAFGAPALPRPDFSDPIAVFFTVSFYLPLLVIIGVAIVSLRMRLPRKASNA